MAAVRRYPRSCFLDRFLSLRAHTRVPIRPITDRLGHKPNSFCTVPRRDTRRARSSHARQLPRFLVFTRVTPTPRWRQRRRQRSAYVNSFCLVCAHVLTLCYARTTRPTASTIYVHACNNNGSHAIVALALYHTTLSSVTERLCRNGCARDAVRDTSTRGHGVPRAAPFSLPLFLSLVLPLYRPLSLASALRDSLLLHLVAYRPVGDRELFAGFCGAAGRLRPHFTTLDYSPAHPPNAIRPPPSLVRATGLSLYSLLRSAHARPLSVFRLVARSADIGGPRAPSFASARGDMTLAWLLPWRLATDAAGAWDSLSTLIRLHLVAIGANR